MRWFISDVSARNFERSCNGKLDREEQNAETKGCQEPAEENTKESTGERKREDDPNRDEDLAGTKRVQDRNGKLDPAEQKL